MYINLHTVMIASAGGLVGWSSLVLDIIKAKYIRRASTIWICLPLPLIIISLCLLTKNDLIAYNESRPECYSADRNSVMLSCSWPRGFHITVGRVTAGTTSTMVMAEKLSLELSHLFDTGSL